MADLKVTGLHKRYGAVEVLKDINLDVSHGEFVVFVGPSGCGKSTLLRMICGLDEVSAGTIALGGEIVNDVPPARRGVAMVFQHFSLFEALNVAENIALGMENPPKMGDLAARIKEVSETYGLPLDPYRTVGDLSAGERQRVEIIRCLLQDPRLLIMDEPTSVLTPQEVEILFKTLRKLTSEGVAILYISHKLEEIRALCESATILRLGKKVGTCVPRDVSAREMAEMMVGSQLHVPERAGGDLGPVLLELTDLSVKSPSEFGTSLKGISLKVRSGEVLGLGGVAGNGQDELLAALSGEIRTPASAVMMEGQPVGALGPTARRKLGLLTAPEERLGHAAAPDMSLTENALLTASTRQHLEKKGFLKWGKAREFAESVIERFDVRTPGPANAARSLSGGNLQKFVIGREVMQAPTVLVVNQPTWGVDAAAAADIRQALLDLAAGGAAVIVISQDLDELMEISDHFGALNEGRLSEIRPARGLSVEEIGLMMGGAHGMEEAHV